jgi:hypothetical protein
MNIVFKSKKGTAYTVTEICYEKYKNGTKPETFVHGGYGDGSISRHMPTVLYKCNKTGRPCLNLGGKMYAVDPDADIFFSDILDKANIK